MFNWLITMFAPLKPRPKACIECVFFGVKPACGRQYCRAGQRPCFPDKASECYFFKMGENPASRGEI